MAIDGGVGSAYDVDHADRRDDLSLAWQRTFATSDVAFGGYVRHESLSFAAPAGPSALLGQSIATAFLRGGVEPTPKLRLDAGAYESHYSTFGSNLDGRFGASYRADAATAVHFSLGTGFRAPLLIERYASPYAQLQLDGNGVFLGQGSADERPERATEYEFGASRKLSRDATADVSLYRTNLRDPVEIFYPLAAVAAGTCAGNSYATPITTCISYTSNVGNAVYDGLEASFAQRVTRAHLLLTARYGLNVAYPHGLDAQFANPTSGGTLVDGAQFLGIPQQQASLQAACQTAVGMPPPTRSCAETTTSSHDRRSPSSTRSSAASCRAATISRSPGRISLTSPPDASRNSVPGSRTAASSVRT